MGGERGKMGSGEAERKGWGRRGGWGLSGKARGRGDMAEGAWARGESEEGLEEDERRKAVLCHGQSWRGEKRDGAGGARPWGAKRGRKERAASRRMREGVKRGRDGRRRWECLAKGEEGAMEGRRRRSRGRREGCGRRGGRAGTGEAGFDRREAGRAAGAGNGDGGSGGPRRGGGIGGVRGQPCPRRLAGRSPAGPRHGQRRLQAQLQEGGDPAHHQDTGEGPPCRAVGEVSAGGGAAMAGGG